MVTRWSEHTNPTHDPETNALSQKTPESKLCWFIIVNVSNNKRTWKNLNAICFALKRPKLNYQVQHNKLAIFRNGIT